ncbi:MAG: ABC transporter permease [Rubrivivax sp.]|nr:ABC transporter permease [Rubrivivax sp.]
MPVGVSAPSLRNSLRVQGRVIWALLLREVITRFGRRNLGVLWLIGEPMLFTLGVTALWSAAQLNHGSGIPIVAFAITGYSSVLMWRNAVSHCTHAIQSNLNLLYHRNVQPIDVFAARIWLEVIGASASFLVLAVFFTAIEMMQPPVDALLVVGGWLMLAWFGGALALLVGAAATFSELVKRLWSPMSYLLFPLSGAAFMVDWLSPAARDIVLLLPMVHGVEMLREGYFGNVVPTHYDIGYMAVCNLVLLFFGLVLTTMASRRVEAE